MRQDVVQMILHFVDPISRTVCRHSQTVLAGIRLDGRSLTSHVWSMMQEPETRREAQLLLQKDGVSLKIPHDRSYRNGTAKI